MHYTYTTPKHIRVELTVHVSQPYFLTTFFTFTYKKFQNLSILYITSITPYYYHNKKKIKKNSQFKNLYQTHQTLRNYKITTLAQLSYNPKTHLVEPTHMSLTQYVWFGRYTTFLSFFISYIFSFNDPLMYDHLSFRNPMYILLLCLFHSLIFLKKLSLDLYGPYETHMNLISLSFIHAFEACWDYLSTVFIKKNYPPFISSQMTRRDRRVFVTVAA
jgi:hypothetical protein